jgi:hypothetical protein
MMRGEGDPYFYLMIPHAKALACAAYQEARALQLDPKRPEWKLFWEDEDAWYHTAFGVRLMPAELAELVTQAELTLGFDDAHVEVLRSVARAAESVRSEREASVDFQLSPIVAAFDALYRGITVLAPNHQRLFLRLLPRHYDLIGETSHTSPFGWFAQAVEDLLYFELVLG